MCVLCCVGHIVIVIQWRRFWSAKRAGESVFDGYVPVVIRGHAVSLLRVVSHLRSGLDGMDLYYQPRDGAAARVPQLVTFSLPPVYKKRNREKKKENSARQYNELNQTGS